MEVKYKFDILKALKEAGYSSTRLRKEKLLSESAMNALRHGKGISLESIGKICTLLHLQPGDLLEVIE